MHTRFQLPGSVLAPPRARPATLFLVLFLVVLVGAGYIFLTYRSAIIPNITVADPAPASDPLAKTQVEDLLWHLESAIANSRKASGEVRRCQEWLGRAAASVDQESMGVEKKRLRVARAASESARRAIEQVREELEITRNQLIERRK